MSTLATKKPLSTAPANKSGLLPMTKRLTPDQMTKVVGHMKKTGMANNITDVKGFLMDKAGINLADPDVEEIEKHLGIKKTPAMTKQKLNRFVESLVEGMYDSPYDLSELGEQPILTDFTSLEELYKKVRKDIYTALKNPDPRAAFDAIKQAIVQAARYGFVTGSDTAHQEMEQEYSKVHSSVVESKEPLNESPGSSTEVRWVLYSEEKQGYLASIGILPDSSNIKFVKSVADATMFHIPKHAHEYMQEIQKGDQNAIRFHRALRSELGNFARSMEVKKVKLTVI